MGKIVWVGLIVRGHIAVVTDEFYVLTKSDDNPERGWTMIEHPDYEVLHLYPSDDGTNLSIRTNNPENPGETIFHRDIFKIKSGIVIFESNWSSSIRTNPYDMDAHLSRQIYIDSVSDKEYVMFNYNERVFDSRQFPGGSFDLRNARIQTNTIFSPDEDHQAPNDFDERYDLPVFGVLNNIGELWIGYSRVDDHIIYWEKFRSPDVIIDVKFAHSDEMHTFDLYVLERSGKCRYKTIFIGPKGIDYTIARRDHYYMHVPGLLSIKNHFEFGDLETVQAPMYLEVADIY